LKQWFSLLLANDKQIYEKTLETLFPKTFKIILYFACKSNKLNKLIMDIILSHTDTN
jgi:hypothetical protein